MQDRYIIFRGSLNSGIESLKHKHRKLLIISQLEPSKKLRYMYLSLQGRVWKGEINNL